MVAVRNRYVKLLIIVKGYHSVAVRHICIYIKHYFFVNGYHLRKSSDISDISDGKAQMSDERFQKFQ